MLLARTLARLAFPLLTSVLVLFIAGCVGMVHIQDPHAYFETGHPKIVQVTPSGGNKFTMVGAHVEADTLMGFVQQWDGMHTFVELPLDSVSRLEAEQRSTTKTAIAIGAGVAGFGLAWFALYKSSEHQGTSQFCRDGLYGAGIPCD